MSATRFGSTSGTSHDPRPANLVNEPPSVRIAARFCGPPGTGNGGYACGCFAGSLRAAQVRLQRPAPLEQELRVEYADGALRALVGEDVIATGRAQPLELELPPAPSLQAAQQASWHYAGAGPEHPFPGCFVCGPQRLADDGLRIFPGAVDDAAARAQGLVAAPFSAPPDLLDAGGELRPEIVWAALDCPGYFAIVGQSLVPMLLGELAVELRAPIGRGPYVVFAWRLSTEGRKAHCGSALASLDGDVLAVARATWIRVKS
jgi:hypothetical protein